MHSMIQITGLLALTTTFALTMACGSEGKETGDTATTTTTTTSTTEPTLLIDLVRLAATGRMVLLREPARGQATRPSTHGKSAPTATAGTKSTASFVDFDPDDPTYDILERTLADGAAVADYTRDMNTVFACGVHDQADAVGMTYTMRVYDTDLNYADCAALGLGDRCGPRNTSRKRLGAKHQRSDRRC